MFYRERTMIDSLMNQFETLVPTDRDQLLAEASIRQLVMVPKDQTVALEFSFGAGKHVSVDIPYAAFQMLRDILSHISHGNAVTVVPLHAELTTQQAAELLNVSRPYVIKLIESNQLPHKMVGTHRRILFHDLMQYKYALDADRLKTLEELSKQAQELNMGY